MYYCNTCEGTEYSHVKPYETREIKARMHIFQSVSPNFNHGVRLNKLDSLVRKNKISYGQIPFQYQSKKDEGGEGGDPPAEDGTGDAQPE